MNADLRGLSDDALTAAEDKYYELAPFNGPGDLRDKLRTVIGVYLSVAQGQGWRPIESAPRDGTVVLVTSTYCTARQSPIVYTAQWEPGDSLAHCFVAIADGEPLHDATHWMPLPAAPAQPDGVSK